MAYTPNNGQIFAAALAGGMSGFAVSAPDGSIVSNDYSQQANAAIALAQAVDTAWGANPNNAMDFMMIGVGCGIVMKDRSPTGTANPYINQSNWTIQAEAIVAAVLKADLAAVADGVTIPDIGAPNNAVTTSLVWQPGGVAGGNVYTTWESFYAALHALGKTCVQVGVDDSIAAAIVPAGNWAFGNTKWTTVRTNGIFAFVKFDVGATIDDANTKSIELNFIEFQSTSNAAIWSPNSQLSGLFIGEEGGISCAAGSPRFIDVLAGASLFFLTAVRFGRIGVLGNGTEGIIAGTAAGNTSVLVGNQSIINASFLVPTIGGASTVQIGSDASTIPNTTNGWTIEIIGKAKQIAYSATTPTDWTNPAPTIENSATDRLASRTRTGEVVITTGNSSIVVNVPTGIDANSNFTLSQANPGTVGAPFGIAMIQDIVQGTPGQFSIQLTDPSTGLGVAAKVDMSIWWNMTETTP